MRFLILFLFLAAPIWGSSGYLKDLPAHVRKSLAETADSHPGPLIGTSFVFAIPNSHLSASDQSYTESLTLTITNPDLTKTANVRIESSNSNFTAIPTTVNAFSSISLTITPASLQTNYMDIDNGKVIYDRKVLYANSDIPISLVVSNFRTDAKGGDTFVVLPTCYLAQEYFMIGDNSVPKIYKANYTNIITIAATQENTTVKLTGLLSSQIEIALGETVTIATNLYVNSVIVTSSAPVAVFSANVCGFSYINPQQCSYEVAMLLPTQSWGNTVPFYKLLPQDVGEVIIRFKVDKTILLVDGHVYDTRPFYSDEYVTLNTTSGIYIQASDVIDVTAIGNIANSGLGAPFYLHIPSFSNFIAQDLTFATGLDKSLMSTHIARIITDIVNVGYIGLDNYFPNPLLFRRLGASDFYFIDLNITPGQHTINNPQALLYSALVYGYGKDQSYAFAPGLSLLSNGKC